MGFWQDVDQAVANALSEIRDAGGIAALVNDTITDPAYVAPANTGNPLHHAHESYNHAMQSVYATADEVTAQRAADQEFDNMAGHLDNAWDALMGRGSVSFGAALKDAFTDAVDYAEHQIDAISYGIEAAEHARDAGAHADLSGAHAQTVATWLNGANVGIHNGNVANLTSMPLVQQMAGFSSVGEMIETTLNQGNHDLTTSFSPNSIIT